MKNHRVTVFMTLPGKIAIVWYDTENKNSKKVVVFVTLMNVRTLPYLATDAMPMVTTVAQLHRSSMFMFSFDGCCGASDVVDGMFFPVILSQLGPMMLEARLW